jgi:hypothetical protein
MRGDLFIRPNRGDNTIASPDVASGYVRSINFTTEKVDLRKPVPIKAEPTYEDEQPSPVTPIDPVANAIGSLSTRIENLRGTIKWVGGLVVVALFMLLMK